MRLAARRAARHAAYGLAALATLAAISPAQAAIPAAERAALIAIYNSTNGADWTNRNNWRNSSGTDFNAPGTECSWYGVTCNADEKHVTELRLSDNNLTGSLAELALEPFSELATFVVSKNQLGGNIPKLVNLQKLRYFDVSKNQLSGEIPKPYFWWDGGHFDVSDNRLSGPIPRFVGDSLRNFYANNNRLSGPIPDLLARSLSLQNLNLSNNLLTGPIPKFEAPQLQDLDLSNNQLTGELPQLFGFPFDPNDWHWIRVDNNLLSGPIPTPPSSLFAKYSKLCPNRFTPSRSDAWDTATGGTWSEGCSDTINVVTTKAGAQGKVSPHTQGRVEGATAWVMVTPDPGYKLEQATTDPGCISGIKVTEDGKWLEIGPVVSAHCRVDVSFSPQGGHIITPTVFPSEGGSMGCSPNPVAHGRSTTCTAVAKPGYVADSLTGCDGVDLAAGTCKLNNVTGPKAVGATFTPTYTITARVNPVDGGEVTCTPNPVPKGQSSSCTAKAKPGYVLDSLTGCDGVDLAAGTCKLDGVISNMSITAEFRKGYAITANADPADGGTVRCTPNAVDHGGSSTCTATANAGFVFDEFRGACSGSSNPCTLSNINSPKTVIARFLALRNITTHVSPAGSGTLSCDPNPVPHDKSSLCKVKPNAGFVLASFTGCSIADLSAGTCEVNNVISPRTVTAYLLEQTPMSERAALIELYNRTDGANWNQRTNWRNSSNTDFNAPGTECSWYGVTCSGGHVTGLDLKANYLHGTLPNLNALSKLVSIDFSDNNLSGPLPALNSLSELEFFAADNNKFSGSIPALDGLNKLEGFRVGANALSGPIPPELKDLSALVDFQAYRNELSGPIPDLSGLSHLQTFNVNHNQLSGAFPDIAGLGQLRVFQVSSNQLTGPMADLSGLSELEEFSASANDLTGAFPAISGLGKLREFDVHTNQLNGAIADLSGLNQLKAFRVENNLLSGKPPAAPSSLTAGDSRLCPNRLQTPSGSDAAWDAAVGGTWSDGCTDSTHTVTATAGPNGSVSPAAQERVHGATAWVFVTPDAGYQVDRLTNTACTSPSWSADRSRLEIVNVTADCGVHVSFKPLGSHSIHILLNPAGGGTVTCSPNPVANGGGSTCTASANSGFVFEHFSGDCTGATCSLSNVTSDKTVVAHFRSSTPGTHAINASVAPAGSGTVTCSPNPVANGASSTCTASANSGFVFERFSGDCTGATCSLSNVTSAKTVVAHFKSSTPGTHAINATADTGGSVNCTPNPVPNGGTAICTATADAGYVFDSFSGACSGSSNPCTLHNVTAPLSLRAHFRLIGTPPSTGVTPVPSLGQWALLLLGLLTAALGLRRLRRG